MTCCLTSISDIKHNVKKSKINSFNCHFPHRKNISDNVFWKSGSQTTKLLPADADQVKVRHALGVTACFWRKSLSTRLWKDTLRPADTEVWFELQNGFPGLWNWACEIHAWWLTETSPWSQAEKGQHTVQTTGRSLQKAQSSTHAARSVKGKQNVISHTFIKHYIKNSVYSGYHWEKQAVFS